MCKFGLEIISVFSGTTCPESLAQYDRNIQARGICGIYLLILNIKWEDFKQLLYTNYITLV